MLSAVAHKSRAAWLKLASPAGNCMDQAFPSLARDGVRQFTSAASRSMNAAISGLPAGHISALGPTFTAARPQVRHFSWAFWRSSNPSSSSAAPSEAPEFDPAAVDTIVDLAGPHTMDAATWAMIHSAAWPHTYAAELALATMHDTFGFSWMTAIPVTVVMMRTAMAPFLIMSQSTAFKMSKAAPQMQDAQQQMMMAIERGVPIKEAQEEYKETTMSVLKENKTGPMHIFYPVLLQLPVFTGYYFALNTMCTSHLPSMVLDAAPYGFDLTTVDPYHALNLAVPATLMAAGYLGMSHKWHTLTSAQQQAAKYVVIFAPVVMTAMFWTFPAALCYYWTCSNLYTLVLELALRHPGLRLAVGLPSIAEQVEVALENQKRTAGGGGMGGLLEMYQKGAAAADKQHSSTITASPAPGSGRSPAPPTANTITSSALSRAARRNRK